MNVNNQINQGMKFNLQVVEGEVLSNHVGLDLHGLTEIVDGFHIGTKHLPTLIQRKKHLEYLLRENTRMIQTWIREDDNWMEYREMLEDAKRLASDYIPE